MTLSIGALSRQAGVKIPTIRYYEQIGLLGIARRTDGQQRRYLEVDVTRLRFIRQARELGFEVDAIRELLELEGAGSTADAELARRHLQAVDRRIQALTALRAELSGMFSGANPGPARIVEVLARTADAGLGETDGQGND